MRVTVCNFPDEADRHEATWNGLAACRADAPTDILVMPEMPFCYWVSDADQVVPSLRKSVIDAHDDTIQRLAGFNAGAVLGSHPVEHDGRRLNEAFIWTSTGGYRGIRSKWYLPDAPDGREALWFDQGDREFAPTPVAGLTVGFQLCSEMMYPEHAREIGLQDGHLTAQPRATSDHGRWQTAAAMSAATSGCFVASANRRSFDRDWFSGGGWAYAPDGTLLAETSIEFPIATAIIDPAQSEAAKHTYPCDMHRAYAD